MVSFNLQGSAHRKRSTHTPSETLSSTLFKARTLDVKMLKKPTFQVKQAEKKTTEAEPFKLTADARARKPQNEERPE